VFVRRSARKLCAVETWRSVREGTECTGRLVTSADENAPGVCYIHGRSVLPGTLDQYDTICREICKSVGGAIVASVEYRLAPMNPFPAAVTIATPSLEWVAKTYHWRPARVGGDSAGECYPPRWRKPAANRGGPELAVQAWSIRSPIRAGLPVYAENDGLLLDAATNEKMWAMYLQDPNDLENPLAVPARGRTLAGLSTRAYPDRRERRSPR